MQKWLKRAGLILFLGLWAAAGLQIWAKKQESREMEAVAAFSNIGTDNRSGIVQYYGKLKKEEQVQMLERREEYLRQIAASLGISSQILVYRTYGEDSQSVVLQKEGANADTVLRLVTWREKGAVTGQSLYANVTIPGGGFEEAQTLRTKMQSILDETMESKRSSVAVEGFYPGDLSEEKKEAIAEQLLEDMHARTVIKNQDGNLYTVYACSPCFSESVRQGEKRVNLALTMYYNSRTQQTKVCAAVPAIGGGGEST